MPPEQIRKGSPHDWLLHANSDFNPLLSFLMTPEALRRVLPVSIYKYT
jgi:hypothetical protein